MANFFKFQSISMHAMKQFQYLQRVFNLTNRFHVAVRLFSNKSQMTSKCGRNKKVADVLTTFWRLLGSITESDERQHGIYLFYITTKSLFYFKIFPHNVKALWLVEKNRATVKPDSSNTRTKRLRMRKVSTFKIAVTNANFTTRTPFLAKIELY